MESAASWLQTGGGRRNSRGSGECGEGDRTSLSLSIVMFGVD